METHPNRRTLGIVACITATSTITITLGLTWPLLAIVLERQGVPAWLNGLSASSQMLAILVVAPLAPRLIGRFGTIRIMAAGIVGMVIALLFLPVFPNVWAWFPIRFMIGVATELIFVGGDIWINQIAREETRGRLIGIYGTFLHAGFAVGPATIVIVGSDSWTALYIGAAVVACGLIPLAFARGSAPVIEGKLRARMGHFLRIAPTLMIAALMFGLIDSAVLALLPVYGVQKGLEAEAASLLLTMFVLGGVMGQIPIGILADGIDKRLLLVWCTLIATLSIGGLPIVIGQTGPTWAAMLVMGITVGRKRPKVHFRGSPAGPIIVATLSSRRRHQLGDTIEKSSRISGTTNNRERQPSILFLLSPASVNSVWPDVDFCPCGQKPNLKHSYMFWFIALHIQFTSQATNCLTVIPCLHTQECFSR